jgi:thymidylate synthase
LERKPRPFPRIHFEAPDGKPILNIEDFSADSIKLEGYNPMPAVKMEMAV